MLRILLGFQVVIHLSKKVGFCIIFCRRNTKNKLKPIRFGCPKPPSSSTQEEAYWEDQFKRAIKRINSYQSKVVVDVSLPNVNVEITPKV